MFSNATDNTQYDAFRSIDLSCAYCADLSLLVKPWLWNLSLQADFTQPCRSVHLFFFKIRRLDLFRLSSQLMLHFWISTGTQQQQLDGLNTLTFNDAQDRIE